MKTEGNEQRNFVTGDRRWRVFVNNKEIKLMKGDIDSAKKRRGW